MGPRLFASIARQIVVVTPAALVIAVLAVIAVLVGLPALAWADPPDPTWNSGIWDDHDFDNVVDAVANTLVGADLGPVIALHTDTSSRPLFLRVERCALALCPLDWFEGRAPPSACPTQGARLHGT